MGEIFDAGPDKPYDARVQILMQNGVAVWDVLADSVRPGSMDSAIERKSAHANDFDDFFKRNTDVHLVCFNGKAAAQLFQKLVPQSVQASLKTVRFVTMPSTSPANAAVSVTAKKQSWSVIAVD